MNQILETVTNSINDLISSSIKGIPAVIFAIIILVLTRFAADFIEQVADRIGKQVIKSHSLQVLFTKTSYILAWVTGCLLAGVAAFPGLRLGDVIATLGLSSVAIGFAFQDIFKNFLAGILLLVQEPFRINDQIIVGEYEGTVESINIRTTQIITYQGERILLPNSAVFTSAVQVRTAFNYRRTDLGVGVDYNTCLPQAKTILLKTIYEMNGVLENPEPEVDLVNFGDSSIDLVVRYWTAPSQTDVRRIQSQVIMAIKQAFDQANINIPYPIRTVYNYNQQEFNDYLPSDQKEYANHS
ncbi:mechanosensitive ion channel family protein [Crocosphaera sp. XPORK-15E]|uniref:mechanosensitive ion channel family protein n=1 Tax=Crocosphaera sp. XPORK-15E TaxID=3110247 RepID=UPI002B21FE49|nr:mechanosensitive ion channel family protein [Crocosphaera sp. XPORK-15E]MEA5534184.1 mechanosensitive ion channel family protein [Crocosphaera sp. XPORK-15E]